jgi:hypothetical protein
MDDSDGHFSNAKTGMDESLEPLSNVTHERDKHAEKHFSQRLSREEGIQTVLSTSYDGSR